MAILTEDDEQLASGAGQAAVNLSQVGIPQLWTADGGGRLGHGSLLGRAVRATREDPCPLRPGERSKVFRNRPLRGRLR